MLHLPIPIHPASEKARFQTAILSAQVEESSASRKGCARCAGVDRGVHKAACCICLMYACMHDARLERKEAQGKKQLAAFTP